MKAFFNKNLLEAGTDEVGRGCIAGPVVAAAVILNTDVPLHPNLNDSKKLTPQQRYEVEGWIKTSALAYGIALQTHEEIDKTNILRASIKAMHLALQQLQPQPQHILVDGNRFLPYSFIPHTCIVKGDQLYASIAAASILAKCFRDRLMCTLAETYPQYQWHKNMGYPTAEHKQAIKKYGISPLHRSTFKCQI